MKGVGDNVKNGAGERVTGANCGDKHRVGPTRESQVFLAEWRVECGNR